MKYIYLLVSALAFHCQSTAQGTPQSQRADVNVSFVMNVSSLCSRLAMDPATNMLYYITSIGNVHKIDLGSNNDELLYTAADHGITYLQGLAFKDNSMILVGNSYVDSTGAIGKIIRGQLNGAGGRDWSVIAQTEVYPTSHTYYDHGYSGVAVNPTGDSLYINSGSRTDHGELQDNGGKYPGAREVPLTSAILRIPLNAQNLVLSNDATLLAPYLFADGTRNSFDLAFMGNKYLIAPENSGDRDDPDELNWIQQGRHYGFPWQMGNDDTPQQYSPYDPNADVYINHKCSAYKKGFFRNDPNYPPKPAGVTFTAPIRNNGPDADKMRDGTTGKVKDGSDMGTGAFTFTPHRSPLGLIFDNDNILAGDLQGDGFMLSFNKGGDSLGLTPGGAPAAILDASQDMLHLKFANQGGSFTVSSTKIITGFANPVDACMIGNIAYVIEYNSGGNGRLFKITFPKAQASGVQDGERAYSVSMYPNPCADRITFKCNGPGRVKPELFIYDLEGRRLMSARNEGILDNQVSLSTAELQNGIYFYTMQVNGDVVKGKFTVLK